MSLRIGIPQIGMRSASALTLYEQYRNAAVSAARANNAALWYAGAEEDLAGFVYQDSTGTTPATGTAPVGLILDRSYGNGNLGPENPPGGFLGGLTYWAAGGSSGLSFNGNSC